LASAAIAKSSSTTVTPPSGVTSQLSISGTPRDRRGWTVPDDYVKDLADPCKRMLIFEEMRASDDAVHTAIEARRQEINGANWLLSTEDQTPLGTEILEFCEDNVYPQLDRLLRLLGGGGIQYGFGCIEPVYAWNDEPFVTSIARGKIKRATKAGGRRIYLRKIAHIRQVAVGTFQIDPSEGDLQSIQQWVFDGRNFRRVEIPADKVLLWVYDQQGDDYFGVPPTRHCYKAWTFKQQLERLNLLSFDKFGVGTPIASEPEGGLTEPERARLALYLKNWRAGEAEYVIHPYGASIDIKSGDGKTVMSSLEWVRAYNLAIAKTYLTQQTELGSTETGARALGETFYEQLGGIVQADCEDLANLINNRLIVPLVKWNFGAQETYPTFAPSQRVRAGSGVATVLKSLVDAGAVHVRPEDEAYLRDVFELPPVAIEDLRQEKDLRDVAAAALAKQKADALANPNGPPAPGEQPPPKPAAPPIATRRETRSARTLAAVRTELAAGAPDPAEPGTSYRTPDFTTWEASILRPDVLARDLDLQATRLTGEVQDVLQQIDAELERQVQRIAEMGAAALASSVRTIAVPDGMRAQLRQVMLAAAGRARDYGDKAVRSEIKRQIGPEGIGPTRAPAYIPMPFYRRAIARIRELVGAEPGAVDPDEARDLHLEAEVDRAVEDELDRREQSARTAVLTALAQAAGANPSDLASVVSTAAAAALLGLSMGRTEQNVQGVVNVGFGIGRADAASAIGDGGDNRSGLVDANGVAINLVTKIYSAVMDGGTCEECGKWDGGHFPIDYPEDYTGVQCPNPRCAGGYAKCRCVWIYVTDLESAPSVPASKGPLPLTNVDVDKRIELALKPVLDQMAARQATPQPISLTVNVDAKGGPIAKTITRNGDGTFTVTETPRAE
jgi:hypothetical protein